MSENFSKHASFFNFSIVFIWLWRHSSLHYTTTNVPALCYLFFQHLVQLNQQYIRTGCRPPPLPLREAEGRQVEIIWTRKLPPPPHWDRRAIKPNHIKFRICSALAPNSPYKRKCWTDSGSHLILWVYSWPEVWIPRTSICTSMCNRNSKIKEEEETFTAFHISLYSQSCKIKLVQQIYRRCQKLYVRCSLAFS